jgi:hypothetical protein
MLQFPQIALMSADIKTFCAFLRNLVKNGDTVSAILTVDDAWIDATVPADDADLRR